MSNLDKYLSIYEQSIQLLGEDKEVQIRPLTTNDIKKLLVYEGTDDPLDEERVLDTILSESVSGTDVKDLYLQDRYYLFLELRKVTKGKSYSFEYTCTDCKSQSIQSVDLDAIEKKTLDPNREKEVEVLNGNVILTLDHITRKEQEDAFSELELTKMSNSEKMIELRMNHLASCVKSVRTPEGKEEMSISDKMDFLSKLPSPEYDNHIKPWFDKYDFGVNLEQEIKCPHCGHTQTHPIDLNNFFD